MAAFETIALFCRDDDCTERCELFDWEPVIADKKAFEAVSRAVHAWDSVRGVPGSIALYVMSLVRAISVNCRMCVAATELGHIS